MRPLSLTPLLFLAVVATATAAAVSDATGRRSPPWVIAHRGSSGDYPELTMTAFEKAASEGADFLELDTAVTRDHHVVVLHEPDLSQTTDVASRPEFAGRLRTDQIDSDEDYSKNVTDYFTWDFSLEEVKRLRKRQRMAFRDSRFDGQEAVPTLREAVRLVKRLDAERAPGQRRVGLLVEVKLCRYFSARTNRTKEDLIAAELESEGVSERPDLVHLQSFELECAAGLKRRLPKLPVYKLQQSATIGDASLAAWKNELSLDGIGVHKAMVAAGSADPAGLNFTYKYRVTGSTDLVDRAHRLPDFKVLVWTLRNEDQYIAWTFSQDGSAEAAFFADSGVDGLITDFPKTVRRVVDACGSGGVAAAQATPLAVLLVAASALASRNLH